MRISLRVSGLSRDARTHSAYAAVTACLTLFSGLTDSQQAGWMVVVAGIVMGSVGWWYLKKQLRRAYGACWHSWFVWVLWSQWWTLGLPQEYMNELLSEILRSRHGFNVYANITHPNAQVSLKQYDDCSPALSQTNSSVEGWALWIDCLAIGQPKFKKERFLSSQIRHIAIKSLFCLCSQELSF